MNDLPTDQFVLVSYRQESTDHANLVSAIVEDLREAGISTAFDQDHALLGAPQAGWTLWMQQAVERAAALLIVWTPAYRKAWDQIPPDDEGLGIRWESRILRTRFYEAKDLRRLVSVVVDPSHLRSIPSYLQRDYAVNQYPRDKELIVTRLKTLFTTDDRNQPSAEPTKGLDITTPAKRGSGDGLPKKYLITLCIALLLVTLTAIVIHKYYPRDPTDDPSFSASLERLELSELFRSIDGDPYFVSSLPCVEDYGQLGVLAKSEDILDRAFSALAQSDFEEVERLLKEPLSEASDELLRLKILALKSNFNGQRSEAIYWYRQIANAQPDSLHARISIVSALHRAGEYRQALEIGRALLNAEVTWSGEPSGKVTILRLALAEITRQQGQPAEALQMLEGLCEGISGHFGANVNLQLYCLEGRTRTLKDLGDAASLKRLRINSSQLVGPINSCNAHLHLRILRLRGEIEHLLGRPDDARELYENAIEISGQFHLPPLATMDLGDLYLREYKDTAKAEALYKVMEERLGKTPTGDDLTTDRLRTALLMNQATAASYRGAFDEAEKLYFQAQRLAERAFSGQHFAPCVVKGNLAGLYVAQKRNDEALELWQEVLPCMEDAYGDRHPDLAKFLNGLGMSLGFAGKFDEAEATIKRSMAIRKAVFGKIHDQVAASHGALGYVYLEAGRFEEGIEELSQAIDIRIKTVGPDFAATVNSQNSLATAYRDIGDFESALGIFRKIRPTVAKLCLEKNQCYLAKILVNEEELLRSLGLSHEANEVASLIAKLEKPRDSSSSEGFEK